MTALARAALERAAAARSASGTENRGFVSDEWGLLPIEPPLQLLPESHRAWDEMAARLPELFRSVTGREVLEAMPELDAGEDALPARYLLRAATLLGHFAHSYVRVRPDPADRLPDCIVAPWTTVCRRLERDQTVLTYDDLLTYNWRLLDPQNPSRHLENLAILTPTVGNSEERIFYGVQIEVHARTAPAIGAMVRAQEAAIARDETALNAELVLLLDVLDDASRAFRKIDPNPHSPNYMDPVVWAKTVAPFAVAIEQGRHAISGAAAPIFQVFDVFLGRSAYESRIGREAFKLRPGFTPNLRDLMESLGSIRLDEVVATGSPQVRGLWNSLLEAYGGDRGFLGVHRRKAYAFLEIAFKVGRSVTTGGFTGVFEDQTWDVADRELEASRQERWLDVQSWTPVARPEGGGALTGAGLAHVHLDVGEAGLRYRPGDRLAIEPRNPPELVERTVHALRATGNEIVGLDGPWRAATRLERLPIHDLIERGHIRPVARPVAKALLAFSESERLARVVNARAESGWELWDLLELMAEAGFDPRTLWRADPWEPYALPKIVPPQSFRMYSLASAMDGRLTAEHVELLAAELRYRQSGSDVTPAAERRGTGSAYLKRLAETGERALVPVRVIPASRFRLPDDETRPIVMFAGGAGMSAFRAFLAARAAQPHAGPSWLLLSSRSERHRHLLAGDAAGIRFDAVVTDGRNASRPPRRIGDLIAANETALKQLADDKRAVFYVCGPTGFASAVVDALESITSRDAVRAMIAGGRLQQDIFTSAERSPLADVLHDASDIADRNDAAAGYWTIIDGAVYDLTEFSHRHPGGAGILEEVAGRDGSAAYRQIEHHLDPEVEAMLPIYQVGTIRRLDLGRRGALTVGDGGLMYVLLGDAFRAWVRYLHLVVEVQNAVRQDFRILDAVTVGGDEPGEMTFLKAQLLLDAHRRFVRIYLRALLGAELRKLWAMSTAFVAPELDVRALERDLHLCSQRAEARLASDAVDTAVDRVRSCGRAAPSVRAMMLAELAAMRAPLQNADSEFLASLKRTITAGVRLFERFERATPERAGHDLLAPLDAIPTLVAGLDDAIARVALSTRTGSG